MDILDFLKPGYQTFMSLGDVEHKKIAERTVTISPRYWSKYGPRISRIPLKWNEVKYSELQAYLKADKNRAKKTGVYVFLIRPEEQFFSTPKFVFYVGISGERGSDRPLRERLREYTHVSKIKKRDRVHQVLRYYYKSTYIQYAEVDATKVDLDGLENNLHGFFYPWASIRDFPVEIKKAQAAWGNN
tara:strand:- start:11358 stop:11918 length:561 start_codon:yes stop_codon:yes gene_type:complete